MVLSQSWPLRKGCCSAALPLHASRIGGFYMESLARCLDELLRFDRRRKKECYSFDLTNRMCVNMDIETALIGIGCDIIGR